MSDKFREQLVRWRTRIDELDFELIRILNERAQCAIEIGKLKRERELPIYDPRREDEVIRLATEHNKGPLDSEGVRRLFERIIDESRRIERVTAEKESSPKNDVTKGKES